MIGANAGSHIAIKIRSAHQRRMPINMAILKSFELGHDARIKVEHAGIVHHFRQTDDLLVGSERQKVFDFKPCASGFKGGGRNTG